MNVSKRTAVLIVDLQKGLTLEGGINFYPTAEEMMPQVCAQLKRMRELGAQLVYVWSKNVNSAGLTAAPHAINPELSGRNLSSLMNAVDDSMLELDDRLPIDPEQDVILNKFTYSAFWHTPLLEILEQKGIENVLVCGIKTNVCCRATAIDAVSHCFKTYMISDMTSTNNDEIKAYHLAEMDKYFAKVIDSGEVIRRLEAGEF